MNTNKLLLGLLFAWAASNVARAEIPRPDGIVFGTLGSGSAESSTFRDVLVFARAKGSGTPLAAYRMGDQPTAEGRYVLRFAHLVSEDGVTRASGSAKAGQQVRIYVKQGDGPEVYAVSARVPASGDVLEVNLGLSSDAIAGRRAPGFLNCGNGVCGAFGIIGFALTFCGLLQMKRRLRKDRMRG